MVKSGSLPTSKMEFFVMIVNSIAKRPILDVPGISCYLKMYNLLMRSFVLLNSFDCYFVTSKFGLLSVIGFSLINFISLNANLKLLNINLMLLNTNFKLLNMQISCLM